MAQRITQDRQLYYGVETTEGTEVTGGNNEVVTLTNLAVAPDLSFNSRSILGQIGRLKGVMGAQSDPGLSFTVQCRGGATTVVPKIDPLLKVVLSQGVQDSPAGGETTVQTGSPDRHTINVASATGFSIGNAVAIETTSTSNAYEVGWIVNKVTSGQHQLILSHDLTFDAVNAASVKPSITYKPQNTGHGSLSFQLWLDATNKMFFTGCKGTMKFDAAAPGAIPTITFNFDAMAWDKVGGTRPSAPAWDTANSPTTYKFKIDSIPFDAKLSSWDVRQVVARKRSQNSSTGTIAQLVTNRDVMGSVQAYDVDETQYTNWKAGDEQAIAHQFGSTPFNIVAYQIPKAQRRRVAYGDDNGLTTDRIAFQGNITNGADEVRLAFL